VVADIGAAVVVAGEGVGMTAGIVAVAVVVAAAGSAAVAAVMIGIVVQAAAAAAHFAVETRTAAGTYSAPSGSAVPEVP